MYLVKGSSAGDACKYSRLQIMLCSMGFHTVLISQIKDVAFVSEASVLKLPTKVTQLTRFSETTS